MMPARSLASAPGTIPALLAQASALVEQPRRGALIAGGLLLIQRAAGDLWPLPAWAAAVALGGLLAALFPVLLLPLFLKSERMAEGELAGETHHDIPRLTGVSEEQKERHLRQEVLTGDGGQKNQREIVGYVKLAQPLVTSPPNDRAPEGREERRASTTFPPR